MTEINPKQKGLTTLELLLGFGIVAISISALGSMLYPILDASTRSLSVSEGENSIEKDLSRIRQLAYEYTWCSGSGEVSASKTGTCLTDVPLRNNYYFPNVPGNENQPPVESQSRVAFENACNSNVLTRNLIQAIDKIPGPENLKRTVSPISDTSPVNGARTQPHVLRVTYQQVLKNKKAPVERVAMVVPVVSQWCP